MASVLVVDDDEEICKGIEAVLKRAGHEVRTANDGGVALDLMDQEEADVTICDIMMPDVDGFEFFRKLKLTHPAVKFIAISGYSLNGSMNFLAMAEAMGAVKVFEKPVDPKVLVAAVSEVS